jgi:CRP-like cAMP-binding protein
MSEITDVMSQVELFRGVPLPELEALSRAAQPVRYADHEMLFNEGDEGDTVYIIQQGIVKIISLVGGQEKQISTVFEGELVGELALLDGRPRSAKAVASGDVHAFMIKRQDFIDFMIARPPVMLALLETLTRRARRLSDLVEGNIEWLGKLARGEFEHATGFALKLAPVMFRVAPSRPLVRVSAIQQSESQSTTSQTSGWFGKAAAALEARDSNPVRPSDPPENLA